MSLKRDLRFYKLTTAVLKQYFPKLKPKVVNLQGLFRNDEFRADLDNEILKYDINNVEYEHFLYIVIEILNKHAAMKQKYLRETDGRFMTKDLHKGIMKGSRLRNKLLSDNTKMSRKECKKQQNFCVNLLKKAKKEHFANLDVNSMSNDKKFWQIVKPLFFNKVKAKTTINFTENTEMIDDEIEIAKLFSEYFVNIVKKLGLFTKEQSAFSTEIAIAKYRNHPSVNPIIEEIETLANTTFGFDFTSYEETEREVNNLKSRKVFKENLDIVSYFLYHNFNNSLSCSSFPTGMNYAEVAPIYKTDDKIEKENYCPISILPDLSKVYERLMNNQIYPYFRKVFSKFQRWFHRGFNAHNCLLAMVEKWQP